MRNLYLGMFVLLISAFTYQNTNAQQCDVGFPSGNSIDLFLDASGSGTLNTTFIAPFATTSDPECNTIYLYDAALNPLAGNQIVFSCANIGTVYTFYVSRIDLGGTPQLESGLVEFFINVLDNIPPVLECPESTFPMSGIVNEFHVNTDIDKCYASILEVLLAPDELRDNCANNTFLYNNLTWTWDRPVSADTSGIGGAPATAGNIGSATPFEVGHHEIVYVAVDEYGNSSTCTFTVDVTDNQLPAAICPANVTIDTEVDICTVDSIVGISMDSVAGPLLLVAGTYFDNCPGTVVQYEISAPTNVALTVGPGNNNAGLEVFELGTSTVTYHFTDAVGNMSSCMFDVVVEDNQKPTIVDTLADFIVHTSSTVLFNCFSDTSIVHPAVDDNCAINPATYTVIVNQLTPVVANFQPLTVVVGATMNLINLPVGTYEITYNVDDMSANSAVTFTYNFEVIDDEAPRLTYAEPDHAVSSSIGSCNEEIDWYRPNIFDAIDNCPPNPLPVDSLTETIISGPDMTVLDGVVPYDPTVPGGQLVDAIFPVGITVIQYGFRDAHGNTATYDVTFTVTDDTAPIAQCNASVTALLDAMGNATITTGMVNDNSYDNCGEISLSLNNSAFDCTDMPSVMVTLTVADTSITSIDASCMSNISIVDMISPTITNCPFDIVVNTNNMPGCEAVASWTHPTMDDNCSVSSQTYSINGGVGIPFINGDPVSATININTVITYNVLDGSGNSNICSFVITVDDVDAPVFSNMPVSDTLNANAACSAVHTWIDPTVIDNCTAVGSIVLTSNISSGNTFGIGIHTVTYVATDGNGNTSTASFDVTVTDNQAPFAQCEDFTIYLDNIQMGMGSVVLDTADIDDGSTDNCGIATMMLSQSLFECSDLGNNIVIMTVSDGVMTDDCSATITVLDTFAPVCHIIPLMSDFNLSSAGLLTINATDVDNNSTDNCTIDEMLISIDNGTFASSHNFNCDDIGIHNVELKLTDQSGNVTLCSTTIDINDVTAPTFTVPGPITIQCDVDTANLVLLGLPTNIFDACDNSPDVTHSDVIIPNLPTTYVIIRTWIVTDSTGNHIDQTQTISVIDNVKPTTTVVDTIIVTASHPVLCTGTVSLVFTDANTEDNCSDFVDLDIINDSPFGVNLLNDASGEYPIGTTTVIFKIEDESNNTLIHEVAVIVEDNNAPNVTFGPMNIVQDNLTNNCFATVFFPRPDLSMVTDCGSVTITESINDYTVVPLTMFDEIVGGMGVADFPVGETTITYEFEDNAGNITTVSYTVTILDAQAPSISCPGDQTLGTVCASGVVPDYTNLIANLISDNCPNWTVSQSPVANTALGSVMGITPLAGETFEVTLIVIDNNNNMLSDTCFFDVELVNTQNPIIPVILPFVDSCGTAQIPTPIATDNCNTYDIHGVPSMASSIIPGDTISYFYNPAFYNVVWTFIDSSGNMSTAVQQITITDDTFDPIINCQADVVVNNTPTLCSATNVDNIGITYFDHCGINTVSYVMTGATSGSGMGNNAGLTGGIGDNVVFNKGVTTIEYTVVDFAGNFSTCSINVTVEDNEAPVLTGVPANTTASCDSLPALAVVTAFDNCDGNISSTVMVTIAQGMCPNTYTMTRTWTAIDSEGNSTSLSQHIFVQDLVAPVVSSFPNTINVTNDFGQCGATVSVVLLDVFLSDNCTQAGNFTVTNNYTANGANASAYYDIANSPHLLIFTVEDQCGNSVNHDVLITITDNQAPTPVCVNNINIPVGALDSVVITSANINLNSFDNCTPQNSLIFSLDQSTFDCDDVSDDLEITMTVTDLNGNSAFCTTSIEIQDNIDPIINCPINVLIDCDVSTDPYLNLSLGQPTASDNCSITTTFSDNIINNFGDNCYTIERTWNAEDGYGNLVSCTQYITIDDNDAPVLSQGPSSLTLGCSDVVPMPSNLNGVDNCDDNVLVTFTSNSTQGNVGCSKYEYVITRDWLAVDNCGNSDVYTQYITVEADEQPFFLNNIPDTVNAVAHVTNQNQCGISDSLLTLDLTNMIDIGCYDFADIYKRNHVVENNLQPLVGTGFLDANGYYPYGQYHIIYSLGDPCGNDTVYHTIVLNVTEDFAPTAVCHDQLVVGLGSNGSVTITPQQLNNGSYDNCTAPNDLIITVINGTFDCSQLGLQEVTLSVEDESGNITTCTSTVTITSDPANPALNLNVTTSSTPESYYGASDGSVSVIATGGSGNYTYLWDDANANTTTSVNGLTFGTYTVIVTDTQSNCQFTSSIDITAGNQIELNVGSVLGTAGSIVQVPVTVTNFNNVNSFTFSIHVVDASIGSIVGVTTSSLSGSLVNFVGNTATFGWVGSQSLVNNTEIMSVGVLLTGNVGNNSPVEIDDNPVPVEVVIAINGSTIVPVTINQGMVGIDNAAPTVELAGNLHRENGDNIGNAIVNLTGSTIADETTGNDGNYFFIAPSNSEVIVTPTKDILPLEGVTAFDLSLILQHIVMDNQLSSTYKMIAADADNSGSITAYDLTVLLSLIVNPSTADFGDYNNTSWRFIPNDFTFPSFNPYGDPIPTFPENYSNSNVLNNVNKDFIGIKIGDVDLSGNPLLLTTPDYGIEVDNKIGERSNFNFVVNDDKLIAGDIIEVPVYASSDFNAVAFQSSISVSDNFEILDIQDFNLVNFTEQNVNLNESSVNMAWFNDTEINLIENQLLFTIKLKALSRANLSDNVFISTNFMTSKVYNKNGNASSLGLEFDNLLNTTFEAFNLEQNIPNPFSESTTINFTIPVDDQVQLVIFNIKGDIVYSNSSKYKKGLNDIKVKKTDIGAAGIYMYQIIASGNNAQKKMMLID